MAEPSSLRASASDTAIPKVEIFALADVPRLSVDHQRKISHQLGLPDADRRRMSQERKGSSDIPTMFQGRKLSEQIQLVYQAHRLSAVSQSRQSRDEGAVYASDERGSIDLQVSSTLMRTWANMSR